MRSQVSEFLYFTIKEFVHLPRFLLYSEVYIFLIELTFNYVNMPCLSGSVNTHISAIMKARDTKFDISIFFFPTIRMLILNIECHAHRTSKIVVKLLVWFVNDLIKIQPYALASLSLSDYIIYIKKFTKLEFNRTKNRKVIQIFVTLNTLLCSKFTLTYIKIFDIIHTYNLCIHL